ncbi:MAG: glycerate kinase [Anaerolineae bacterium]|nr:glycerate kinase [Anaerolineae bacterium]
MRKIIAGVLGTAIRAVDPAVAVKTHITRAGDAVHVGQRSFDLNEIDRIIVVGGGKAGTPMAAALHELLGPRISAGVVNVKYGHTSVDRWQVRFEHRPETERTSTLLSDSADAPSPPETGAIRIVEAGHPVPDAAGLAGAAEIATILSGLTPRDLVFVLISGGGSALLPLPVEGVTLADTQALTSVLLRCGADITEINAIRKHCSRLQGGQLARLAAPAQVVTLILSDVVGTPLDAIASGPTVPDRSTFADATAILRRYGILDQIPGSVRGHVVIGDNASAGRAAVAEARRLGFSSALLTTFLQGEAREVGRAVAGLVQGIACGQSDFAPPACLVLGGETTVTIRGQGSGGRNQELALAAAIALDSFPLPDNMQAAVVSLGTDGTDGPTDAAGGIAWPDTVARGRALSLDARAALAENDSYPYLGALGDLIVTGPTGTNVNDLVMVTVR